MTANDQQNSQHDALRDHRGGLAPAPLGEIARRAAARARQAGATAGSRVGTEDPRSADPAAVTASGANGAQRPHVSVRPHVSPRSSTELKSAAGGAAGAAFGDKLRPGHGAPSRSREDRDLVGEALVQAAPEGSELVIPPGSRITPAARDLAFEKSVTFVTGRYAEVGGPIGALQGGAGAKRRRRSARIAIASDHGGFALKAELVPMLKEFGDRPHDLGPGAAQPSVDYPDFARLVAEEVSRGRADLGIIVDGAGIGSAMVANKFPGARAANCWNVASAKNAREHNHANILTLGSGHLDLASARAILSAFLATDCGDDRHARRAAKLQRIERDQLRSQELASEFDEGR